MKNFKFSIAWLAMFALIFTSCSKEEANQGIEDQELIQLSFGSIMNDFNDQNKQASPGECREGTPSYVWIGITDSAGNYIGDDGGTSEVNLIEVGLKWNANLEVWETVYSEELALPAGDYELQHFIVYDTNDQVLWVAPRLEGAFGGSVSNPLPQDIVLVAGTKPYITVDVLCYIARSEEAYGYLFFDIILTEVENSYCVFVNYCDDGTEREYPSNFRLDIWSDGYGGSDLVVSEENSVDMTGDWAAASVLCVALPEIVGDDLYARITVLDDAQAYTPGAGDVEEFRISQADLDEIADATPAYDHVRINCGDDPGNGNGGGNGGGTGVDPCELDPLTDENCTIAWLEDSNALMQVTGNLPFDLTVDGERIGDVTVTVESGVVAVNSNLPVVNGYVYSAYEIWISSSTSEDDLIAVRCVDISPSGTLQVDLGDLEVEYNELYIRMRAYVCGI